MSRFQTRRSVSVSETVYTLIKQRAFELRQSVSEYVTSIIGRDLDVVFTNAHFDPVLRTYKGPQRREPKPVPVGKPRLKPSADDGEYDIDTCPNPCTAERCPRIGLHPEHEG